MLLHEKQRENMRPECKAEEIMVENNTKYNGIINRDDCLIVVIDVQEKLMPVISDKERVIANTATLVKFSVICGIPVIVTEQQKLGPTVEVVKNQLKDTTPIEKIHFNCFWNEKFKERVETGGRKTLVIAGVEAHICVAQTAIFALPEYRVHVISDAASSRAPENKGVALQRMHAAGAVISSTEMFIYEMLEKAGTDEFKATLPLVK